MGVHFFSQQEWIFVTVKGGARRVIHASLQKCRPITAEIVVVNVSIGRR